MRKISEAIVVKSGVVSKSYVDSNLALKQDKVTGKGLSTNDYSDAEKTKLDGIEEFATAVGKSLAGQSVMPAADTTVTAGSGAEIFNDYNARAYDGNTITSGNVASGSYSHAEGAQTTASGHCAHAEGYKTKAGGAYSHAQGEKSTASGKWSHAEGCNTISSANNTHAEGSGTKAQGNDSHTEGYQTTATQWGAHAEGKLTTASGEFSHAEGISSQALGEASHAGGYSTKAKKGQTVVGRYNKVTNGCGSFWEGSDGDAFIVGNGTGDGTSNRTNAFRVSFAGKVYGQANFSGSGAGVAELFEWADGNPNNEDRRGLFVTLEGDKIRIATPDDSYILGMIDPCPFVVGDVHSEIWKDMYKRDVFGEKIFETVEVPESTDEEGNVTPAHTEKRWVLNPEFDPTKEYVSRDERKEFAAITSKGKVVMIDDGTCEVNKYCTVGKDGKATASDDNYAVRVLKRIDENHIYVYIDRTFLRQFFGKN